MMKTETGFALTRRDIEEVSAPRDFQVEEGKLLSFHPALGVPLGEVALTPVEEAGEVVLKAQEAQRSWERRPLRERIKGGEEVFQEVLTWRGQLLELLEDETGKAPMEARRELLTMCEEVEAILKKAPQELTPKTRKVSWMKEERRQNRPRGVALVVASAYEPLGTTMAAAVANLVVGNAVIVMADGCSPLTVSSLGNIATGLDLPEGLWQTVVGGRSLLDKVAGEVDVILSYGSAVVTRRLARSQSRRMIPVYGRWPTRDVMVVLSDADMVRAARAAVRDACGGGGQMGRALGRIYVQDTAQDRFVDALIDELARWRRQDATSQERFLVGPLLEERMLEGIERLVEDATARGARLISGGRRRPRQKGNFYEPTILTGVDESMGLWNEAQAGPVLAVAALRAPIEAVHRTAELASLGVASIFTESRTVAEDLADRIQADQVTINEGFEALAVQEVRTQACLNGPIDVRGVALLREVSRAQVIRRRGSNFFLEKIEEKLMANPLYQEEIMNRRISMKYRRGLERLKEAFWP